MRAAPFAALLVLAACGGSSPEAEAQDPAPGAASASPPTASGPTPPPATGADGPAFVFPVACEVGRDCEIQHYVDRDPGPEVLDYRCGPQTYEGHDAVDIRIPDMAAQARGVAVLAAASGKVLRTRDGVEDVSAAIVGKAAVNDIGCGNAVVIDHGNGWISGYCHMAKGSVQVKSGDTVAAGQPIGRIGLSGLTEFPHLHFSVRRGGAVVDPMAPGPVARGSCPTQASLWTPEAARQFAYKDAVILNAGFAGEQLDMTKLVQGTFAPAGPDAPVLVTYMRAIMLRADDALQLVLTGPDGKVMAEQTTTPFGRTRAHQMQLIGKRRPATGWPPGVYRADLRIVRGGKVVAEKRVETRL